MRIIKVHKRITAVLGAVFLLVVLKRIASRHVQNGNGENHSVVKLSVSLNERPVIDPYESEEDFVHFDNGNEQGKSALIIPNIIHYIRFDQLVFSFTDAVCLLSAFKNHKPNLIMIHTNIRGARFVGVHWLQVLQTPGVMEILQIHYLKVSKSGFTGPNRLKLASDFYRIRLLRKYGGIFLANDIYVVKQLHKYRRYEIVLPYDNDTELLKNQIIFAHRNARFLRKWEDSYSNNLHVDDSTYNSQIYPTVRLYEIKPHLTKAESDNFLVTTQILDNIYTQHWNDWRNTDAVWLMVEHRRPEMFRELQEFGENCCLDYPYSFGEMARDVYPVGKHIKTYRNS